MELLDPSGEAENSVRVARGEADFSLSRVAGHLVSVVEHGPLAARFAAVMVRRSPISVFVPVESDIVEPAHLSGRRVGGAVWAMAEFTGGMAWLGLEPAAAVPMSRTSGGGLLQEACGMLGRREIDAVADYEDLLPRARRHSGLAVRTCTRAGWWPPTGCGRTWWRAWWAPFSPRWSGSGTSRSGG